MLRLVAVAAAAAALAPPPPRPHVGARAVQAASFQLVAMAEDWSDLAPTANGWGDVSSDGWGNAGAAKAAAASAARRPQSYVNRADEAKLGTVAACSAQARTSNAASRCAAN